MGARIAAAARLPVWLSMTKPLFWPCWVLLLAGCQSAFSPYDGVVGYRVTEKSRQGVKMVYVETAMTPWENLRELAREACASELATSAESVYFTAEERDFFRQQVPLRIALPGATGEGGGRAAGGSRSVRLPAEQMTQEMPMRQLTVACQLRPAAGQ